MKSYKPEDIVTNLTSLGYDAEHITGVSLHEKSSGNERNHIKISTGRRVDAVLYLDKEVPTFITYGKYPEGHQGMTPDDLKKFNTKMAMNVKARLTGPVMAALIAADAGGVDLVALAKGFSLKARGTDAPASDLDDDTPTAPAAETGRSRPFKQQSAPGQSA